MAGTIDKYIRKARAILDSNWTGSYTMPAPGLYPHQWNWDSAFIAIGYSHYNTPRAIEEMRSLFNAQWKNGMLPQIVFNKEKLGSYFPEPDFWQIARSSNAPDNIQTSGITMPPIHAVAVLKIYENAGNPEEVIPFLKWIYPRILSLHRYLYEERSPDGNGLVYIRHPWESGMDNSPMWDMIFCEMELNHDEIPPYHRVDLSKGVEAEMRPRNEDYDRFVYLVDLFRKTGYDERAIRDDCPFLIYGPLFNAVLSASNEALIKIGDIIGRKDKEPAEWYDLTNRGIREKLYHERKGLFYSYDMISRRLLESDTAASFLPLFCGAPTKIQASLLYDRLNSASFCALHQGNCFTVPNYDIQKRSFERKNYWRGPVWININWMLMNGLRRYGYRQKADAASKDILQLPIRFGFNEYYDSLNGRPYGSTSFSWTAALFLDTAYESYIKTGELSLRKRAGNILWSEIILNDEADCADVPHEVLSQKMLSSIKELKDGYYTEKGTVDYAVLRESEDYLQYRKLAARLRGYNPELLERREEKLAFWINLYNTMVVEGIIRLGINTSVKEVVGFFFRIKYDIGGLTFSLNDIEHGILRANSRDPLLPFKQFCPLNQRRRFSITSLDPRIHFALVCGSRSCAPIKFYTPEHIEKELELAALNFINSSEVVVVPEEGRIFLSEIFKWYEKDFGGRKGVLQFIERYTVDDDKKGFIRGEADSARIEYLFYDWNLNKQ